MKREGGRVVRNTWGCVGGGGSCVRPPPLEKQKPAVNAQTRRMIVRDWQNNLNLLHKSSNLNLRGSL